MSIRSSPRLRRLALLAALASFTALAADEPAGAEPAAQEPQEIGWEVGPKTVSLGDQAQIELTAAEAFLDGPKTIKLKEALGTPSSRKEVGALRPTADDQNWVLMFEYDAVGYVKDDEKDEIDADGLFESIREGTEEANEYRKEHGAIPIHAVRWTEAPHYDSKTHNLVWGILGRDDNGEEIINWRVKVLGREGVMSVTLIDDPARIEASKVEAEKVLSRFSYKPGKTYAEWRQGDKIAEYGLTALVAAGAGAAAVKMGLFSKLLAVLAKGGKAIIVGLLALGAGAMRVIKGLFSRRSGSEGP